MDKREGPGSAVADPWTATWHCAWTRGNGGRAFFDHETGWEWWVRPRESEHADVVEEETVQTEPDRYEEIPGHVRLSEKRMKKRATKWVGKRG